MFLTGLLFLTLLVNLASTQNLWPSQSFETVGFHPPVLETTKSGAPLADGSILFTPETSSGLEVTAVMIMTDDGELVWNGPNSTSTSYTNLFMQTLDDEPILSYWAGIGTNIGYGYGNVTILDTTYSTLYTVCPEGSDIVTPYNTTYDCYADPHESFITPRNSILVTKVNVTRADLTSVNGSVDGWVFDAILYEIDIKTNEVLFHWSALEAGIPINATKAPLGPVDELKGGTGDSQSDPFDWFHANSIQSVGDGYLISSRHLWTTWMLNSTGDIQWSIQGDTGGDFSLPEEGQFEWQHEPRISNITPTSATLHCFNNRNAGFVNANGTHQTDGLELLLDFENFSITVNHSLADPADPIFTTSQGSFSRLSNGNYFMGYGGIPKIKEYSSDGTPIMALQFGNDSTAQSYRAYRQEWHATPAWDPVAVGRSGVAYMSWNGATDVTKWDIYTGLLEGNLTYVGTVANSGFETSFNLSSSVGYLQVSAFDGDNFFLRNSSVVALS